MDTIILILTPRPNTFRGWSPVLASDSGHLPLHRGVRITPSKVPSHDRHHLAPLRHFSLFGESSDRAWPQGPCLGIGRTSRHHAETESDGADGRLSQDAGSADWRG